MIDDSRLTSVLSFRGLEIAISSDDEVIAAEVASDFSFMLTDAPSCPTVKITLFLADPPDDRIPGSAHRVRETKDATVFEDAGVRYLDSDGQALVVWRFADECIEIYSAARKVLREKSYLMIMSRLGYYLDRAGMHRIHAMSVAFRGRAVVCAMAMGGGKTTLTLGLMEQPEFQLLSDEVPLVTKSGRLVGFPIRLGVREDAKLSVPDQFVSRFTRSRYPPKLLIDANYFRDRIAVEACAGIFFVGNRTGSLMPEIHTISKFRAFRVLLDMCVLARGVPELLEYVLRTQPRALFRQGMIYFSRLRACVTLVRRSDCYALELSNDPNLNTQYVAAFVAKQFGKATADRVHGP